MGELKIMKGFPVKAKVRYWTVPYLDSTCCYSYSATQDCTCKASSTNQSNDALSPELPGAIGCKIRLLWRSAAGSMLAVRSIWR